MSEPRGGRRADAAAILGGSQRTVTGEVQRIYRKWFDDYGRPKLAALEATLRTAEQAKASAAEASQELSRIVNHIGAIANRVDVLEADLRDLLSDGRRKGRKGGRPPGSKTKKRRKRAHD